MLQVYGHFSQSQSGVFHFFCNLVAFGDIYFIDAVMQQMSHERARDTFYYGENHLEIG